MGFFNKLSVFWLSIAFLAISAVLFIVQFRYSSHRVTAEMITPAIASGVVGLLGFWSMANPAKFSRYLFTLLSFVQALGLLVGGIYTMISSRAVSSRMTDQIRRACTDPEVVDSEAYSRQAQEFVDTCPADSDSFLQCIRSNNVKLPKRDMDNIRLASDTQNLLNCGAICTDGDIALTKTDGEFRTGRPSCLAAWEDKGPGMTMLAGGVATAVGLLLFLLSVSACKEPSDEKRRVVAHDQDRVRVPETRYPEARLV